jgi:hypothetical protein
MGKKYGNAGKVMGSCGIPDGTCVNFSSETVLSADPAITRIRRDSGETDWPMERMRG